MSDPAGIAEMIAAVRKFMQAFHAGPPVAVWETFGDVEAALKSLTAYGIGRGVPQALALTRLYDLSISSAGKACSGYIRPGGGDAAHKWGDALYEADLALNLIEGLFGQGEAGAAMAQHSPDTALPSVDDEDVSILRALARRAPLLLNGDDLAQESNVSRRTITCRMPRLLDCGLVEQPNGPKSGTGITPLGRRVLDAAT
jgi:hypothetical protein